MVQKQNLKWPVTTKHRTLKKLSELHDKYHYNYLNVPLSIIQDKYTLIVQIIVITNKRMVLTNSSIWEGGYQFFFAFERKSLYNVITNKCITLATSLIWEGGDDFFCIYKEISL